MTDPALREREVTAVLDEWDWDSGGCLIGGYAASAYGKPRYSRDLDFVVPTVSKEKVLRHLDDLDFSIRPLRHPERPGAFHDSITLHRGIVSIDLMVGHVRDRETKISVPEAWISSRYREMRLILMTGSTTSLVRVCRPEALWVLKLISGRNQDLSDLFAISPEPIDTSEIREFLAGVTNPALKSRLEDEARRLASAQIYADSLSARFLTTSSADARRSWDRFKHRFHEIASRAPSVQS